jgi:peptidoglycan/LPS O-acetylase OafA/YrhL
VNAFWVLSGFLITRSMLQDEKRDGAIRIGRFYSRQAIRYFIPLIGYIVPLVLFIAIRFPGVNPLPLLRPLLLDPSTYCVALGVSHLYSLVMQIYFWLAWPLVLKTTPPALRLPVAIGIAVLAFVWNSYGSDLATAHGTCFGRVDYFFAPIILGSCFALFEPTLHNLLRRRFALPIAFLLVLLSILLQFVDIAFQVQGVALALGLSLIVVLLVNHISPAADRVLGWPGLTWLGRISFSVYLWQNLFCYSLSATPLDRFPANILAAVLFGWLAYRLVELPSLRWRSAIAPRSALSPRMVPVLRET